MRISVWYVPAPVATSFGIERLYMYLQSTVRNVLPFSTSGACSGRTWDRIETRADRPEPTLDDFFALLQGLLVDADGRPITLSTTRIHSALGRIRDMAAAGDLGRIVEALVRELGRS